MPCEGCTGRQTPENRLFDWGRTPPKHPREQLHRFVYQCGVFVSEACKKHHTKGNSSLHLRTTLFPIVW